MQPVFGSWEFAHPVYMCVVNVENAYDYVHRVVLLAWPASPTYVILKYSCSGSGPEQIGAKLLTKLCSPNQTAGISH